MKRYDIDVQPDRSYYGDGTAFIPVPYESVQGDWVRQEDVEALLALNAQMLEALKLVQRSRNLMLASNPPKLAWDYYNVDAVVDSAVAKAEGRQG